MHLTHSHASGCHTDANLLRLIQETTVYQKMRDVPQLLLWVNHVPKNAVVDASESFNLVLRKPAMCLVSPALNLEFEARGSEDLWWLKFLCPRACYNIQDSENLSHVF